MCSSDLMVHRAGGAPILLPSVVDEAAIRAVLHAVDGVLLSGGGDVLSLAYGEEPHPASALQDAGRDAMEFAVARIARELGVKEGSQQWLDMQRGSLLHDVGKIGVSDSILLKPGKLDPEEWEQMRRHPEIGYNMLYQVKFLQGAAEIILCHHERWDGKGYPRGLRGEEIPLGARIFPVADTFDAITSDRPYRKAKSALDAMNEILRCSGSQFDPLVVEAFLDIYQKWVKELEELRAAERAA